MTWYGTFHGLKPPGILVRLLNLALFSANRFPLIRLTRKVSTKLREMMKVPLFEGVKPANIGGWELSVSLGTGRVKFGGTIVSDHPAQPGHWLNPKTGLISPNVFLLRRERNAQEESRGLQLKSEVVIISWISPRTKLISNFAWA